MPYNYTNGFKLESVLTALTGRIGWRQPTVSSFTTTLSSDNIKSNSGRYFQDFHPILTPGNIKDVQEDPNISDDDFNALLLNLQQAAITKILNGIFNKRELIEQKLLFERYGRQDYVNPNVIPDTFVGIRIMAPRDFQKSAQIDSIYLYFDSAVTFNLYLFHDTKIDPVWTQSVTTVANSQTVVNLDQQVLNYVEEHASGVYYLGYFQNDLGSAQAINEIVERFNTFNCFGIIPTELYRRTLKSGFTQINVNNVSYTIKTHGLNLRMSAFRDHTQMIIHNAYLFDELIGLQMAAMVIEMIGYSTRTNKNERITTERTQKLLADLNGTYFENGQPATIGLKNQIQRETARVKANFFPKHKITTITYNSDTEDVYGVPQIDFFGY